MAVAVVIARVGRPGVPVVRRAASTRTAFTARRLGSAQKARDRGHNQIRPGRNRYALDKHAGRAADAALRRALSHKAGPGKVSALLDLLGEHGIGDADVLAKSD